MTTLNKAQSEGIRSDCARYQKQIARLKRAFVVADDESVRRSMKYEDKILKLIAELVWLKTEDSSGSQNKKKVLEEFERPV